MDPDNGLAEKNSKEILVAIDGSKYSEKIVKTACKLAQECNGRLTLLYVAKRPTGSKAFAEYAVAEGDKDAWARYVVSFGEQILTSVC